MKLHLLVRFLTLVASHSHHLPRGVQIAEPTFWKQNGALGRQIERGQLRRTQFAVIRGVLHFLPSTIHRNLWRRYCVNRVHERLLSETTFGRTTRRYASHP